MKAREKRKETTEGEMLRLRISSPTAKSNTLSQMLDSYSLPCYTASTASEQAHGRLRNCNKRDSVIRISTLRVRTGPRPIEGLQLTGRSTYPVSLRESEQAHARLRDCNWLLPILYLLIQSP